MKKILSSGNFQIIKRGVSLVVVLTMLVVSIVWVAPNLSLGWFTSNDTVTATGKTVVSYSTEFIVSYRVAKVKQDGSFDYTGVEFIPITDGNQAVAIFDALNAPGDKTEFQVQIESTGSFPVTIQSFGFQAPIPGEEVARVVDGKNYYLSTEIYTKLIDVSHSATQEDDEITWTIDEDNAAIPLRASANEAAGAINYFEQINGADGFELEKGDALTFTVQLEFLNRQESQNQFKVLSCTRRLFFTYDE